MLTYFGAAAVGFMMLCYALESRGATYTLLFALGCFAASAYGWLYRVAEVALGAAVAGRPVAGGGEGMRIGVIVCGEDEAGAGGKVGYGPWIGCVDVCSKASAQRINRNPKP